VRPRTAGVSLRREDLMSIKHRLRTLLVCLPLLMGAFSGMPMRPEEIEELMHNMNQQKIVVTVDDEKGDDTRPKLPNVEP
jgi:hypothetical protein